MRGREYEESIRLDYLKRLNERYDAWISTYDKGNMIVIDVDEFGMDSTWSTCLELKDDMATRRTGIILISSTDDESLRIKGFDIN